MGEDNITIEFWSKQIQLLRQKLHTDDVSKFLTWDFIQNAMFHEAHSDVFHTLHGSKYWDNWRDALNEDNFGCPRRYYLYPQSSGNLLWHAYSLMQLYNHFDKFDVTKQDSIFEFGGGYGSLCRLIHKLGFNKKYCLYDIEDYLGLQKLFLSNTIGLAGRSIQMCEWRDIQPVASWPANLFVALWSLSESPFNVRDKILGMVKADYYLITFHKDFGGDNVEYFNQFVKNHPNYNWVQYDVPNIPNNYYLLGQKR